MTPAKKKSVLMVSHDVVGEKMAGPGIRYFMLAEQLAKHFEVTLAVPNKTAMRGKGFKIVHYENKNSFPPLIEAHDFLFVQLLEPTNVRHARLHGKAIIYDFYNLIPIEYIGSLRSKKFNKSEADELFKTLLDEYRLYMASGSFFVCSNERQADFWMGMLTANQAISPSTEANRTVSDIVGLVPFGLSGSKPRKTKEVLKGVVPGIGKDDFVLVWAGGIWDWFDPLTAIKAMDLLKKHHDIKLVFMGTRHPNAAVGQMPMADQAIELAKELGLYGKSVFFLEGWLKFEERTNYLLEADAAISTHLNTLESRYSFRTRILDHFWAGLPSVVTKGDWFADFIQARGLGKVVSFNDPKQIMQAILDIKDDAALRSEMKNRIKDAAAEFTWENVSRELIDFIDSHTPQQAAKLLDAKTIELLDPKSRLLDKFDAQSEKLQKFEVENIMLKAEKVQLNSEIDGMRNSKKWRIASFLVKIMRLGRG